MQKGMSQTLIIVIVVLVVFAGLGIFWRFYWTMRANKAVSDVNKAVEEQQEKLSTIPSDFPQELMYSYFPLF